MATFQFVFDYRSPYAYLANTQLATLPQPADYVPVDIVAVMDIVGNQPSPKCPAKARYAGIDAARWARIYGVPFAPNRAVMQAMGKGDIAADLFSRAACAAQELGVFEQMHNALFTAYWGVPEDLLSDAGRTQLLRAQGIDVDVWQRADDDAIRQQLRHNVEYAAEKGIFGAPSFLIGDELFFGNDRLEMVRATLQKSSGGQAQ